MFRVWFVNIKRGRFGGEENILRAKKALVSCQGMIFLSWQEEKHSRHFIDVVGEMSEKFITAPRRHQIISDLIEGLR
jgi:hypothetical protein